MQSTRDSLSFMDFIADLNLVDLELKGKDFTWSNRRAKPALARMDHFLFSHEWKDLFLASFQQALCSQASEHIPTMLDCAEGFYQVGIFHFESW